jgi:hypothetical protein
MTDNSIATSKNPMAGDRVVLPAGRKQKQPYTSRASGLQASAFLTRTQAEISSNLFDPVAKLGAYVSGGTIRGIRGRTMTSSDQ